MKNPYALMIVDDLDIASLDFRQTLDGSGYSTELVLNEQVNVEQIARTQPNIIFAHFSLPEVSGLDALAEMRKDERLKDEVDLEQKLGVETNEPSDTIITPEEN